MTRYFIIAISFFMVLSACSQPMVYNGDRLPKTKTAEVYYSADQVKKPFKVIGHVKAHKYADNTVKRDLIYFGRSVGADAVIVTGGDGKYVNADVIKFN